MSTILKISKDNQASVKKRLERMAKKQVKSASIRDFYGALPDTYGDGLTYQNKMRHEWE